jgi:hypothetical protein
MNGGKILEVIGIYRLYFEEKGIKKVEFSKNNNPSSQKEILSHCHNMLDKMERFIKSERIEKSFRWLGFIQGCLWATKCYSLNDLKDHNRP